MNLDLKHYFSRDDARQNVDYTFSMKDVEIDGVHPFISPISVKGTLRSFAGSVELEAELNFDFSMPCNRCMEEYLTHCKQKVSHTLVRSLNEEDSDSYILVEGDILDLDELMYSDILLELPVKYLCKEDCKGICPTCGKNLNEGSCKCSQSQTDPRFEALRNLIQ